MQGRAFLQVAEDLVTHATEAHWRTGATCAYYALLLEARDTLQGWGFPVPPLRRVTELKVLILADYVSSGP
jgi:hypothetical protein